MLNIETLEDFYSVKTQYQFNENDDCILRLYDNKSNICLQTVVFEHPISFLRNFPDFAKQLRIPVTDIDIRLIGLISSENGLIEIPNCPIISPYLYFKKPNDVNISVDSDGSVPPTES